MRIRASRALVFAQAWTLAALLVGCHSAQPAAPASDSAAATTESEADEAQRIADAVLGKQAEILNRGDLVRNGREQLLVVNRLIDTMGRVVGTKTKGAVLISRAVVLEKSEGKWREILRCDEHLKNPYGYLVHAEATGWELVVGQDSSGALDMEFTSAIIGLVVNAHTGERRDVKPSPFVVRWNTKTNRYQAYDRSQKRYLRETTGFEMPESVLK